MILLGAELRGKALGGMPATKCAVSFTLLWSHLKRLAIPVSHYT